MSDSESHYREKEQKDKQKAQKMSREISTHFFMFFFVVLILLIDGVENLDTQIFYSE